MSKNFWIDCFKSFLKITIPTLCTIISFVSIFCKSFEVALNRLGIVGLILISCFCFSITLLLELSGLIKFINDIEPQYLKNNKKVDKSLYSFYKSYKGKRSKEINSNKDTTVESYEDDKQKCEEKKQHKYLLMNHTDLNIILYEISNHAYISASNAISMFFNLEDIWLKNKKTCARDNLLNKINNDETKYICYFEGFISGICIVKFDNESVLELKKFILNYQSKKIVGKEMLQSLYKEISSILTCYVINTIYGYINNNSSQGKNLEAIKLVNISTDLNLLKNKLHRISIILENTFNVSNKFYIHMYLLYDRYYTMSNIVESIKS